MHHVFHFHPVIAPLVATYCETSTITTQVLSTGRIDHDTVLGEEVTRYVVERNREKKRFERKTVSQ
jgi:hypothetical protein